MQNYFGKVEETEQFQGVKGMISGVGIIDGGLRSASEGGMWGNFRRLGVGCVRRMGNVLIGMMKYVCTRLVRFSQSGPFLFNLKLLEITPTRRVKLLAGKQQRKSK